MNTVYWLIVFVILLLIEIFTMGLTTIWFAGGALAAYIVGMAGVGTVGQISVFIVASLVLLVFTRPWALKYFNQNRERTNAESLIGQQGVVLEEVDTLKAVGKVEVNGQEWSAKTEDPGGKIAKETVVQVDAIQGVKLVVKQKEEKKNDEI